MLRRPRTLEFAIVTIDCNRDSCLPLLLPPLTTAKHYCYRNPILTPSANALDSNCKNASLLPNSSYAKQGTQLCSVIRSGGISTLLGLALGGPTGGAGGPNTVAFGRGSMTQLRLQDDYKGCEATRLHM